MAVPGHSQFGRMQAAGMLTRSSVRSVLRPETGALRPGYRIFAGTSSECFLSALISITQGSLARPERSIAVTATALRFARGNDCVVELMGRILPDHSSPTFDCTNQNRFVSAPPSFQLTATSAPAPALAVVMEGRKGGVRSIHVSAGASAGRALMVFCSRAQSVVLRAVDFMFQST